MDTNHLIKLGAQIRLREIAVERTNLLKLLNQTEPDANVKPGRKRPMSPRERREVSARMKRYWARRRKAKKAAKTS